MKNAIKKILPWKVKTKLSRILHWYKIARSDVKEYSPSINIYHCTVHKTGSQWIKKILYDTRTYQYSSLKVLHEIKDSPYGSIQIGSDFQESFPENFIASPLYTNYENFSYIQ